MDQIVFPFRLGLLKKLLIVRPKLLDGCCSTQGVLAVWHEDALGSVQCARGCHIC